MVDRVSFTTKAAFIIRPGWIVLARENFSVNTRAYRKQTIEVVVSGFLSVSFFKFYIWRSWLSPKTVENNDF